MKKHTAEDLAASAWAAALGEVTPPVEAVPPGWYTFHALSDKNKIARTALQRKLKHLVATGQAERKMFCVRLAQCSRPVPHYRLLK